MKLIERAKNALIAFKGETLPAVQEGCVSEKDAQELIDRL